MILFLKIIVLIARNLCHAEAFCLYWAMSICLTSLAETSPLAISSIVF